MRVYLDNQLVTYILSGIQNKLSTDPVVEQEINSMVALSQMSNIELLISEEVLAEIRKLPDISAKRKDLEQMYQKLKQGRGVISNSTVNYNDPIATYNSPDVFYGHPFTDKDLDEVRRFLKSKGNQSDFDARYIANAMLLENKIDVFLTADKKTIWNHRVDIMAKFGVMVKLPSELATELLRS